MTYSLSLGPVILDLHGIELDAEERELLQHPAVGGVILFARNHLANNGPKDAQEQLTQLVKGIRAARPNVLITVDHEGGRVQRFREGFTVLPAMQMLGRLYQEQPQTALIYSRDIAWLLASELLAFDIDLSFTPVLDIDEAFSDIIGDRAFSPKADAVTALAGAFIEGLHSAGMAATGKHFPGHGGVKADSHLELPCDLRTLADLEQRDLVPFTHLLPTLDAVMPAHIVFPKVDAQPVGFSRYWCQEYLRSALGFRGVIFSDDLSMEGAAGVGGYAERALLALSAGCDGILVCNNRAGAITVIDSLNAMDALPKRVALETLLRTSRAGRTSKAPFSHEALCACERWQAARQAIDHLQRLS